MKTITEYLINHHINSTEQISLNDLKENDYFVVEFNGSDGKQFEPNKMLCKFNTYLKFISNNEYKQFTSYIAMSRGTNGVSIIAINMKCGVGAKDIIRTPNNEEYSLLKEIDDKIVTDYKQLGENEVGKYDYNTKELNIYGEFLK